MRTLTHTRTPQLVQHTNAQTDKRTRTHAHTKAGTRKHIRTNTHIHTHALTSRIRTRAQTLVHTFACAQTFIHAATDSEIIIFDHEFCNDMSAH